MKKILIVITVLAVVLSSGGDLSRSRPQQTTLPASTEAPFSTKTPSPTVQPSEGGQVNVTCNNTLADAAIINSAIAESDSGDEIVINGPCLINQTIKLLGDRAYRGESRTGTVLKQADDANLVALLASDTFLDNDKWTGKPVSVRHLTLNGNQAVNGQSETAGIILRSWLSVVEDLYITDMRSDGLRLTNKSANGTELVTTQVNGRISENFIERSGRYGIYAEDSQNAVTDWILSDNWIAESGVDGVHLENAAGWIIERNHIYGVPQNAIHAHRIWGTSISDNYIQGFGETTQTGIWYGIYAAVQGGAASTISDNRIFNIGFNSDGIKNSASTYRYLALTVNYGTGVVSVTGNTIRGTDTGNETGLYYTGGNNQLIVTSTGNAAEGLKTKRLIDDRVTLSEGY